MRNKIALLVIEDNRLLREAIAAMLDKQPDLRVIGAAAGPDTGARLAAGARAQVVLLDAGLGGHDSLRLVEMITKASPDVRVIVMALLPGQEDVVEFVRAGVSGFILKDATLGDYVRTIRSVAEGASVLPSPLAESLFAQVAGRVVPGNRGAALNGVRLTGREREVIDLIGDGLSNKETAQRLRIATPTVKSHVHNILEKLALHTRLEVAAYAREKDRWLPGGPVAIPVLVPKI